MKGFCECLGVGRVKECKSLKNYEKKNAIFTVKVDISKVKYFTEEMWKSTKCMCLG